MTRSLTVFLFVVVSLLSLAATPQPRLDTLQALLATETQLAKEARTRYLDEREQQAEALAFAQSASEDLDAALAEEVATPLAELERLRVAADAATVAAAYSSQQAREARLDLFNRRRRIDALERQIRTILGGGNPDDPITGRWRVRLGSPVVEARFELQLNGTLVAGTFTIPDGPSGSLRGTYADGQLNLERVDEQGGIAGTYLGTVDPRSGRASGLWTPNDLSAGGPGMTGWSAERIVPDDQDNSSDEPASDRKLSSLGVGVGPLAVG